jgi:DNA mismatch endonuclease (patch repair protein)
LADNLSHEQRIAAMRGVKARDTSPEIAVRYLLRSAGVTGYRLHRNDLPGKPDIAFIGRKAAIFVHGCFWHGHDCRRGSRIPKTNRDYWPQKIERNRQRDTANIAALHAMGWKVLVIWECEIGNQEILSGRLRQFLNTETPSKSFQRRRQEAGRR